MSAIKNGYDVSIITNCDSCCKEIEDCGIKVYSIDFKRRSLNVFNELKTIYKIYKILRQIKPDIVHNIALKPIINGSIAAKMARVPYVINAIVGLGIIFIQVSYKFKIAQKIILNIYKFVFFITKSPVIFENQDDIKFFLKSNILKNSQIVFIKGAGVNIDEFKFVKEPETIPVVAIVSRMLRDKGIYDLTYASNILKNRNVLCRIILVGDPDKENLTSIPIETLNKWNEEGVVEWLGRRDNIPEIYAESHIAVLPSFREGLPKSLIEAASCGRPIVATNVPGCREIVRDNVNGLLVPPNNPEKLADAIEILVNDKELREKMGMEGRKIVENELSEEIVVRKTMKLYNHILNT